jgi:hypothetical protein
MISKEICIDLLPLQLLAIFRFLGTAVENLLEVRNYVAEEILCHEDFKSEGVARLKKDLFTRIFFAKISKS